MSSAARSSPAASTASSPDGFPMTAAPASRKTDVSPEFWDNVFAPSSCLVLITTVDREGRVNAAAFGTCTRVCHDPVYIAFTCGAGKGTYESELPTGELVLNLVPSEHPILDTVVVCGRPFAPGVTRL